MPYATQSDLLQHVDERTLVQLTDDSHSGKQNDTVVSGALETASGRVDAYCRSRYNTPLQQSDMVTDSTVAIAIYALYGRRPGMMPELVTQRYQDAIAFLKDVSSGKAVLDQPVGAAAPQSVSTGPVLPTRNELRFTDRDLKGFV